MFNRQPFNRGKFNTYTAALKVNGLVVIDLTTSGGYSLILNPDESISGLEMDALGDYVRKLIMSEVAANINLNADGDYVRKSYMSEVVSATNLNASGEASRYGYLKIELLNLVIPPGGEIVIDTEEMTITLNGEDIIKYMTFESEFFKLNPGDNFITYEDNSTARNVNLKFFWKDRWI